MKTARILVISALVAVFGVTDIDWTATGPELSVLGSPALARMGHPLTPYSAAGVARRTARRTTRRLSVLPHGCVYGPYYGAHYYNCGGVYYQRSGNVYVQVIFE